MRLHKTTKAHPLIIKPRLYFHKVNRSNICVNKILTNKYKVHLLSTWETILHYYKHSKALASEFMESCPACLNFETHNIVLPVVKGLIHIWSPYRWSPAHNISLEDALMILKRMLQNHKSIFKWYILGTACIRYNLKLCIKTYSYWSPMSASSCHLSVWKLSDAETASNALEIISTIYKWDFIQLYSI